MTQYIFFLFVDLWTTRQVMPRALYQYICIYLLTNTLSGNQINRANMSWTNLSIGSYRCLGTYEITVMLNIFDPLGLEYPAARFRIHNFQGMLFLFKNKTFVFVYCFPFDINLHLQPWILWKHASSIFMSRILWYKFWREHNACR